MYEKNETIEQLQNELIQLSQQTLEMKGKIDDIRKLEGSIADTKERAIQEQQLLRITPNIWPVSIRTVTSGYGIRKDPFAFRPSFHSTSKMDTGGAQQPDNQNNDRIRSRRALAAAIWR